MVIEWSDEDECFLVALPDFPGQYWRTHGSTYEEAVANGKEALESLIDAYRADGKLLPEPTLATRPSNSPRDSVLTDFGQKPLVVGEDSRQNQSPLALNRVEGSRK
jgi:antitoxin HicB